MPKYVLGNIGILPISKKVGTTITFLKFSLFFPLPQVLGEKKRHNGLKRLFNNKNYWISSS